MWRPLSTVAWAALVVLILGLQTVHLTAISGGAMSFTIHWNSSNSIFRIDNTDNVIDVNRGNLQFEYDQANLICPVYTPGTKDDDMEKYIIYNVSKDEYETCRITNPNPRIIAVCDKPYKLMYFTITFRPFTPQPGGLEFLPGHDYYFISTSTSDDLHRRIGGRCTTHNMKIVFKVWGLQETTSARASTAAVTRPTWTTPTPPHRTTPSPPPHLHPHSTTAVASTQRPTKKSKPHLDSKRPNEVMKSEELILSGTSASAPIITPSTLILLIVASVLQR